MSVCDPVLRASGATGGVDLNFSTISSAGFGFVFNHMSVLDLVSICTEDISGVVGIQYPELRGGGGGGGGGGLPLYTLHAVGPYH